ncbi:hypothetical protein M0805_001981 [Coniferiporia weirii]|nr:hypothetical protein M0805_001981 [Coniferiporia weirii]
MSVASGSKRSRSGSESRPRTPQNQGTGNNSHTSPLDCKVSGSVPHSNRSYKADALQIKLHAETKKFFLGPMPIRDFLDTFLPSLGGVPEPAAPPLPNFERISKDATSISGDGKNRKEHTSEHKMYQPFIDCMNGLQLESLKFVNSSGNGDEDWIIDGLKPDISVYRKESSISGTRFSEMELFIELKPQRRYDPFESKPRASSKSREGFVKATPSAQHILGQMISYVIAQLGSGFRTHVFSVLILGDTARFIRWDRAGAVVTEPIEYTKESTDFAEFFRRFDRLTPEQRGHDTTVSIPTAEELAKAREAFTPIRRVLESDESFQSRCDEILGQTFYNVQSLVGRASRGSPVFDLKTGRICYLKDTWRIDSSLLSREGDIYERLHKHSVPHVATLVDEGDVWNVKATTRAYSVSAGANVLQESPQADGEPLNDTNAINAEGSSYTKDVLTAQSSVEPFPRHRAVTTTESDGDAPHATQDTSTTNPQSSNTIELGHSISNSQDSERREDFPTKSNIETVDHNPPVIPTNARTSSLNSDAGLTQSNAQAQGETETMHATITQSLADRPWVYGSRRRLPGYIHYRLVLGTVGRDLTSFRSTKEMLTAIADAMEAHGKAYEDAGILHRDISPGNIMITEDGEGFLIDWDLAKDVHEQSAVRQGRTGTWQFISAALLLNPRGKRHTYANDLESFLHLVTFLCVRYSSSSLSSDELGDYLEMFDEDKTVNRGGASFVTGGLMKERALSKGKYIPEDLTFPNRPKLRSLLKRFSTRFKRLYKDDDGEAEIREGLEGAEQAFIDEAVAKSRAQRAKAIDNLHKWSGEGQSIHAEFKEALRDGSAWPVDDKSQLMAILRPYFAIVEITPATIKRRTEMSNKKRSKQTTSYGSSCMTGSRAISTVSTDELYGSGRLPSMHESDEGGEHAMDGCDDGGPPKKRSRAHISL